MKTNVKDFSMEGYELAKGGGGLEELISNRQAKLYQTTEYRETDDKIEHLLNKLKDLPEAKEIAGELEDEITSMECICFSAGYRDGVADLMAALTFNKLNITNVEYYKFS
jgi:translation initiation factor IF-2